MWREAALEREKSSGVGEERESKEENRMSKEFLGGESGTESCGIGRFRKLRV